MRETFRSGTAKKNKTKVQVKFSLWFGRWIRTPMVQVRFPHGPRFLLLLEKNLPVLTIHGNPPLANGGPPMATGEGKLAYVEAFPPVVHQLTTGGKF